jgi:hypothetical protein
MAMIEIPTGTKLSVPAAKKLGYTPPVPPTQLWAGSLKNPGVGAPHITGYSPDIANNIMAQYIRRGGTVSPSGQIGYSSLGFASTSGQVSNSHYNLIPTVVPTAITQITLDTFYKPFPGAVSNRHGYQYHYFRNGAYIGGVEPDEYALGIRIAERAGFTQTFDVFIRSKLAGQAAIPLKTMLSSSGQIGVQGFGAPWVITFNDGASGVGTTDITVDFDNGANTHAYTYGDGVALPAFSDAIHWLFMSTQINGDNNSNQCQNLDIQGSM